MKKCVWIGTFNSLLFLNLIDIHLFDRILRGEDYFFHMEEKYNSCYWASMILAKFIIDLIE